MPTDLYRRTSAPTTKPVQGISFGAPRPILGFQPEEVLPQTEATQIISTRGPRQIIAPPPRSAPTANAPRRAAELYERRFAPQVTSHVAAPEFAFDEQRAAVGKAREVANLIAQRAKMQTEERRLLAGAALAEELAALDARDPEFTMKMAAAHSRFAEGGDTEAAKAVRDLKKQDYSLHTAAQTRHREEVFNATVPVRLKAISESEHVSPEIKSILVGPDGSVNRKVLEQAEMAMNDGKLRSGGKAGAEFYNELTKKYGLTASDLDLIETKTPGVTQYQDARGRQVSAEDVQGKESASFAVGNAGEKSFRIPLDKFTEAMLTHANLTSAAPISSAAPSAAALQEQADRLIREASDRANGLPPNPRTVRSAESTTPTSAPNKVDALTLLRSKLGTSPSPTGTPAPLASQDMPASSTPRSASDDEELSRSAQDRRVQ